MRKEGSGRFFVDHVIVKSEDRFKNSFLHPYIYMSKTKIIENKNFNRFAFTKKMVQWGDFCNNYIFESEKESDEFFNGVYKDFIKALVTLAEAGVEFNEKAINTQELRVENQEILKFIIDFYGVDDPRCGAAFISLFEVWKNELSEFGFISYNINMFKLFTTIDKKLSVNPSYEDCVNFLIPARIGSEIEKFYHNSHQVDLTSFYKTLYVLCNPDETFKGFFDDEETFYEDNFIDYGRYEVLTSYNKEKLNAVSSIIHSLREIHKYHKSFESNDSGKEKFRNSPFQVRNFSYDNYEKICAMKNSALIESFRYYRYFQNGSDMIDFYLSESIEGDCHPASEYLIINQNLLSEDNKKDLEDLGAKIDLDNVSNQNFIGAVYFFLNKYKKAEDKEKLGWVMDRIFSRNVWNEDYDLSCKIGLEEKYPSWDSELSATFRVMFKLYIKYMNDNSTIPFPLWRELIIDENE